MPAAGNPLDALGATIVSLEERVAALEAWRESHMVGVARRRQAQVDAMRTQEDRARWLGTLRGRRR